MTAIAAGQVRFAKRDGSGKIASYSGSVDFSILDNAAVPRVVYNRAGTSQDQVEVWDEWVHGSRQEVLEVQILRTAALTFDTSDFVIRLQVEKKFRGAGGRIESTMLPLSLGDRITKSTASTINDPRGLNDDGLVVVDEWSPVLRFAPAQGENWRLYGYQFAEIHDNV